MILVEYKESPWSPSGNTKKTCRALTGRRRGADDAWCETSCNSNPPYCPVDSCQCTEEPVGQGECNAHMYRNILKLFRCLVICRIRRFLPDLLAA